MGAQRLHRHLRRLPAARRTARRPARTAPDADGGHRPVRPGLAGRRTRPELRHAGRRAAHPGARRRPDVAGRAVPAHHHLQLRHRPGEGARRLGRHGGHLLHRRGRARRGDHRLAELAVGAVREPARLRGRPRRGGAACGGQYAATVRQKGTWPVPLRPARRRARHRRDAAACLRAGARAGDRVGRERHDRRAGGRGGAARRCSRSTRRAARTRWSRWRSSGSRDCRPPTRPR